MMKRQLPILAALAVLLPFASIAVAAQSQSEQLTGEGTIVAFHKQWRHPIKPYSSHGIGTPADLWIVRIDRWTTSGIEGQYFRVDYAVLRAAVSDKEIKQKLRFQFRKPAEGDGPKPCEGPTSVGIGLHAKIRPARMSDFQRTQAGRTDSIPPLKDLACLIADEPPTRLDAQRHELSPKEKAEELRGEGAIVAFQKYDRYHGELYRRGLTTVEEEWIVRIDRWMTGNRNKGYFVVTYENLPAGALSNQQMSQPKWFFTFRNPEWYEAESCAGNVPLYSKDGNSYHGERPARLKDFQRTKQGLSDPIPSVESLPCLIAEKLPSWKPAPIDPATVDLHLTIPLVATTKPSH
jgi:hypothetical protein